MKTYSRLKRSGLKRGPSRLKRGAAIPRRSTKLEGVYAGTGATVACPFCDVLIGDGRRDFVGHVVEVHPACAIRSRFCTVSTQGVHESIRGAGRALVPGPKADETGQTFFAACHACNGFVASPVGEDREWATVNGFIQSRFGHA